MIDDLAQDAGRLKPTVVERQSVERGDIAGGRVETVILLELLSKLLGQQRTYGGYEALEAAAGAVVEGQGCSILADHDVEFGDG
jgi:hypothetical protein